MSRDALMELARDNGLKPHPATGEAKLRALLAEHGIGVPPPVADKVSTPEAATDAVPPGHLRVSIRRKGADRICTGERVNDPVHPHDQTFPEGAVIDLPKDIALSYIDRDWVDLVQ